MGQKFAVLDEQKTVDDQRRNGGKIGEHPFRMPRLIDHIAVAVADRQAGLRLLAINGETAVPDEFF